jgi:hypothetical protein
MQVDGSELKGGISWQFAATSAKRDGRQPIACQIPRTLTRATVRDQGDSSHTPEPGMPGQPAT